MTIPSSGPVTFTDIQTEFGGTNPIALNEYYAGGGLVPAGTTGTYGAVPSSGQISVQNFYGTTAFTPVYIEDVFSTYLYTGTGASNAITNNIDLSTNGGLVWIKQRNAAVEHFLYDTARGVTKSLSSNDTTTEYTNVNTLTAFGTSGFTLGSSNFVNGITSAPRNYVSWTFRKQPKFFDVVTYSGNSVAGRTVSHNLGSVPGCIIVKTLDLSGWNWYVYHRGTNGGVNPEQYATILNDSGSQTQSINFWNNTAPTSTQFSVGGTNALNGSGGTYVAYLFAHNAGGFGATGTDNVISCGSMTADGSGNFSATVGFESQWVLVKGSSASSRWDIFDNMRGVTASSGYTSAQRLNANLADAEDEMSNPYGLGINATGFTGNIAQAFGNTLIYIAIRRGPMKVPTVGTTVFNPNAYNGTGTGSIQTLTTNFPVDLYITCSRQSGFTSKYAGTRLTGKDNYLVTNSTGGQSGIGGGNGVNNDVGFASNIGIGVQGDWNNPSSPGYSPFIMWNFKRAPSVFDVVCYTGTGSATTVTHNLTVAPQMMIIKRRSSGADWTVYHVAMGASKYTFLDGSTELSSATIWNATTPTASVFSVGPEYYVNASASTYVAYLFATLAGVSKVGSYTGTSALQTVNCGFTTGARFVLIHRIDSGSNNWFVYDSARGITSGDDPYLALNSTANEIANTNYVDTTSVGFQVTAAAPAELNANGGTYIFLAIA